MLPVTLLSQGESAEIVSLGRNVISCDTGALERASDMGLRAGQRIEVLANAGDGPLLLKVENTRIAVGRAVAHQIHVAIVEGRRS